MCVCAGVRAPHTWHCVCVCGVAFFPLFGIGADGNKYARDGVVVMASWMNMFVYCTISPRAVSVGSKCLCVIHSSWCSVGVSYKYFICEIKKTSVFALKIA